MGAATRIAAKDLKLRIRDRSAFILGIFAPLVLAIIFNLIFGGAGDPTAGLDLRYGIVDLDRSDISMALTGILAGAEEEEILTLEVYSDAMTGENAIEDGEIDAFFLIEEGFGQSYIANQPARMEVVGNVDAPTSTQIAASFAEGYNAALETSRLAVVTTASLQGTFPTEEFLASLSRAPQEAAFSFSLVDASAATRQLDATTYLAAGMAVFFLFFTVQFGVLGLLEEERDGTLVRLLAAPMQRTSLVVGKAMLAFGLGVVSMGVLVGTTSLDFLMGANWGAPLGVTLLVVTGVLAAVGIMGLVASVAKTAEGAGNLGAIIAVILGMLGGVFFPIGTGDDLLSKLTLITPHAWFMRGLADLAGDAPWTNALPAAGAMALFALVTGGVSWVLLQRRLAR